MADRIFNVHDLFLIIAIFEVVILAGYRAAVPHQSGDGNQFFIVFLFLVALDMAANLVLWNPVFPAPGWFKQGVLVYVFAVTHFARGPLFYFYVKALLFSRRIGYGDIYHAAPLMAAVVMIAGFGIQSSDLQSRSDATVADCLASAIWYVSSMISVGYVLVVLRDINRYMARVKQRMSSVPLSELVWLAVLSVCFLVNWSWSFLVIFLADLIGGRVADTAGTLHNLIRFLLINGLIFYNLAYAINVTPADSSDAGGHDLTPVPDDVLHAIRLGIERHKLHLQPSINIDQFAERIGVPSRTLSQAINRELGTRFFEFINHHRVEHAKALLADEKCASMSILDILLASGFNNKSSFHRFFNRLVGCSPTEYRRKKLLRP